MLASANLNDVTRNQFYVLSKFALTYPRLKAGGALLPDLIEFYQWIHTELAYLVTKKYAQKNGFEEVITKADQKYEGRDLFKLYERVKGVVLVVTRVCTPRVAKSYATALLMFYYRWLQQVCRSDWRKYWCWGLCQCEEKCKDLQDR